MQVETCVLMCGVRDVRDVSVHIYIHIYIDMYAAYTLMCRPRHSEREECGGYRRTAVHAGFESR